MAAKSNFADLHRSFSSFPCSPEDIGFQQPAQIYQWGNQKQKDELWNVYRFHINGLLLWEYQFSLLGAKSEIPQTISSLQLNHFDFSLYLNPEILSSVNFTVTMDSKFS